MYELFLNSCRNNTEISDCRWSTSKDDISFFNDCVKIFKENSVKTLLDIGTGLGNLVKICADNGIDAYGIDPILFENHSRLYQGTMSTVIQNQHLLGESKFSCISCVNFLHGKDHKDEELISLFKFMKAKSDYILITEPNLQIEAKTICMENLHLLHSFPRSHGGAYHSFYKILN